MKRKKFLVLTLATVVTGMAVGVVAVKGFNGDSNWSSAEGETKITFSGTNGNATVKTLKTSFADTKTARDNDVKVVYKNVEPVASKVGKILKGGYYGNQDPIHDITMIKVFSDATEGKATLFYGPTSAYMPFNVDLSAASSGVIVSGASYFKIVANDDVNVESIVIDFGCETKDFGPIALNSTGNPLADAYQFSDTGDNLKMHRKSSYSAATVVAVPDTFDNGSGEKRVTVLGDGSSTGCFEGNGVLEKVYLPETITTFDRYLFYTNNNMTEFTLPRDLVSTSSNPLPKNKLEVLNINSINLSSVSTTFISSSNTPKLHTINVSYDVEFLPNLVFNWPSTMATINYEGTEAEWATLTSAPGTSSYWTTDFSGDVICSDTVLANVSLHFAGATLGDDADSKDISIAVGKSFDNPGSPVYNDGTKKFVGWYDDPVAGNIYTFPFDVAGDLDLYAHFEDYGAGVSFDNPIIVTMGNGYDYSTDSTAKDAYFRFTADEDMVFTATITSAASAFSDYIYMKVYDGDKNAVTVETGNAATTDVKAVSMPSSYGTNVPLKVRIANGETVYIKVNGNDSATRFGDFHIDFAKCVANDGRDYTTAKSLTANTDTPINILARYGVTWYSFTPSVSGEYMVKESGGNNWFGGSLGYIDGDGYHSMMSSNSELNCSAGNTVRKVYTFEAGHTYYFGFTENTINTSFTLLVTTNLDAGIAKSSAIEVTVGADPITVTYDSSFATVWYKFTAASAGKYRLVSGLTIYTSGSSTPLFAVEDADGSPVAIDAGRTALDKVIDVDAGVYYVSIKTSNSAKNFNFSIETVGEEATVSVYANGPTAAATSSEVIDAGTAHVLANPTYDSNGHTYYTGFEGWFTDTDLTVPFTSGDIISGNTNIYAKLGGTYQSDLFNEMIAADHEGVIAELEASETYHFVKEDGVIVSTNGRNAASGTGVKSSYSGMKIEVSKNVTVSFDYLVSSENSDRFYVYSRPNMSGARTQLMSASGTSVTEYTHRSYVLEAGQVIEFVYQKDSSVDTGNDMVKIRDLAFVTASEVDLTYNFNDGVTADQIVSVISGASITKIADPSRSGYRFDGWYTTTEGTEAFNFSNGITVDTTIYAKWVETVTVTVYADGPDKAATEVKVIDKGSAITLADLNTSSYHGFEGWFTSPDFDSESAIASGDTVNSNISVYAKLTGSYRSDFFNTVDAAYSGFFSNISGTDNSYRMVFDADAHSFTSGNYHANSQTSEISFTLKVDAVVSFSWTLSSESGYDKATIRCGDVYVQSDISGTKDGSFNGTLTAGTIITFRYTKDSSTHSGDDVLIISNFLLSLAA